MTTNAFDAKIQLPLAKRNLDEAKAKLDSISPPADQIKQVFEDQWKLVLEHGNDTQDYKDSPSLIQEAVKAHRQVLKCRMTLSKQKTPLNIHLAALRLIQLSDECLYICQRRNHALYSRVKFMLYNKTGEAAYEAARADAGRLEKIESEYKYALYRYNVWLAKS